MKIFLLILFLSFPFNLYSKEIPVKMTKADCLKVLLFAADYVPDISATGQAVTPANLPQNNDYAEMPVTVFLPLNTSGVSLPNITTDTPAFVKVTIKGDDVLLNGEPLNKQSKSSLLKACLNNDNN